MSRSARQPTGIDRIERVYARRLLDESVPLYGLVATRLGYLILDQSGVAAALEGVRAAAPDFLSRFLPRGADVDPALETALRRNAVARSARGRLTKHLARVLPPGTSYINLGHSNLRSEVFGALRQARVATATVFLHDTIPLDHPETQKPGTVASFQAKLAVAAAHADHVICPSRASAKAARPWLAAAGRVPQITVAHLGPSDIVEFASVPEAAMQPYFLCLGSLEPRKNLSFLLDLWQTAPQPMGAELVIVGPPGWAGDSVVARAEQMRRDGLPVRYAGTPDDTEVSALLRGAAALLAPSLAEGFGLSLLDAAFLGTPIICHDLPVTREILGDIPVYADVADQYAWRQAIHSALEIRRRGVGKNGERGEDRIAGLPSWNAHFDIVLSLI
ncbi:MAG: glycosyltransferase [Pseudomonadota bacterium]